MTKKILIGISVIIFVLDTLGAHLGSLVLIPLGLAFWAAGELF